MAPVMVADESSDRGANSQDVEESSAKSEDTGAEIQLDEDDYNSSSDGESDCSVTSFMNINQENGIAAWDFDPPAPTCTELVPLTADSEDTTWTDDKHSSYLDCIEATFVRKMYDKEYCSLDVCGHSSHSSVTWDQDSAESRPFFLNMRKPTGQVPVGLLPSKDRSSPWLLAPSVLASPWIQHFKCRQSTTPKLPEMKDKCEAENVEELTASEPAGLLHKPVSDSHAAVQSSSCLATTKRGFSSGITDCRISVVQSAGHNMASQNNFGAGRFKKLKCQQALSRLDMEMEEQFNSKQQQSNVCPTADGQLAAAVQENGNVSEQCMIKQMDGNEGTSWQLTREKGFQFRLDTCSKPAKESSTCKKLDQLDHHALNQVNQNAKESSTCKKLDQVVPFEDAGSHEASGQNVVPEIEITQNSKHSSESKEVCVNTVVASMHTLEQGISKTSIVQISGQTEKDTSTSVDPTEPERFTAVSGSKTWTWGIEGTRHQHLKL